MKAWLLMLPLLCAAPVSLADSIEAESATEQVAPPKRAVGAAYHYRIANNRIKRLPSGDIRHCLGMQSNEDIIRCSETRRRK